MTKFHTRATVHCHKNSHDLTLTAQFHTCVESFLVGVPCNCLFSCWTRSLPVPKSCNLHVGLLLVRFVTAPAEESNQIARVNSGNNGRSYHQVRGLLVRAVKWKVHTSKPIFASTHGLLQRSPSLNGTARRHVMLVSVVARGRQY